jgi:adenylylsulfate kinase
METTLQEVATRYLSLHAPEAFQTIQPLRGVYEKQSPFSAQLLTSSYPQPLMFLDGEKGTVTAFYVLGQELAGHPNILHGGASAALLDELMGRIAVERLPARKVSVTVSIDFKYKGPVFLSHVEAGEPRNWAVVAICADVKDVTRRVAKVEGWIANLETGEKLVECQGVFVEPREAGGI